MYEYLEDIKIIQSAVLDFLDEENGSNQSLIDFKNKRNYKSPENIEFLEPLLCLLMKISIHHHRKPGFYQKIEQILLLFKDDIIYLASFNEERLFNLFCKDKKIILFLIKEKILPLNLTICKLISDNYYDKYFSPEFKLMIDEFPNDYAIKVQKNIFQEIPENFEEFRNQGENENYLCKLVQNDQIDEFIICLNKTNTSIDISIDVSVFDTNRLLMKKPVSLIEYATFYGSIQIFNYLRLNGIPLERSLLIFAIHGDNPEILHIIEENVEMDDQILLKQCYKEAIKCHHNNFAQYIRNQYLIDVDINELADGIKYSNYIMYPNLNENYHFFKLYQYDIKIAELYIKDKELYKDFYFNDKEFDFSESIGERFFGSSRIAENKNTHKKYLNKIMYSEYIKFEDIDKLMNIKYPSLLNPIGYSKLDQKSKSTVISVYFEYFPNGSLESYTNMHRLNSTQKYIIILGLAIAFIYLHKKDIVHISFHLRNILLDENLYPVMSDFTISHHTFKKYHRKLYKEKKMICNIYQSPEGAQFDSFFPNSNVYSFAMIIYQMISEKQPYNDNSIRTLTNIMMAKHPNVDNFDEYTREFLKNCWQWHPKDRPNFDQIIEKITDERFFENFKDVNFELDKKYLDIFGNEYAYLKNKFKHE